MVMLQFPKDLTPDYYIDIKFKKYSRPDAFTGKINLTAPSPFASDVGPVDQIHLPIPANLIDSQTLKWSAQNGLAGQFISDVINGQSGNLARDTTAAAVGKMGQEAIAGAIGQLALSTIGSGFSQGMAAGIAQSINAGVAGIAQGVLQNAGVALNPILTQMFDFPEFKTHEFAWILSPDNADESYVLKQIINAFKYNSLPSLVEGGVFFGYPNIALINLWNGINDDLYRFQPSVITNVTVNWAAGGSPSFFANTKQPTLVEIRVAFLEIILNSRQSMISDVTGNDFSVKGAIGSTVDNAVNSIARTGKSAIDALSGTGK